ncbi:hypothetical protein IGJ66_001337 [Enterococcus sp. DIV0176]|uniref:Rgg/GadR/MutR family transcriptional regulator n=1 Tax=Enterococcus sp. DIV0176 TaxID=2774758 RepID=UPI003D2FE382
MNHGKMIKKLRTERRISRKRLVKEIHSISTLQRFENGEAKIDIDSMWLFLERMNIQLDEYCLAYHDFQTSKKEELRSRFRKKVIIEEDTLSFLEELESEYQESGDVFYLYLIIQIKAVTARMVNNHLETVNEQELNEVYEYLARVECWGYFELAMYTNCLSLFKGEFRLFNTKDVISQFRKFNSSMKYNYAFIKFLVHSIILSFEAGQYTELPDLLSLLHDTTNDSDFMKGRLYWRFFKRLYQSVTDQYEFDGSMAVEVFKFLGYDSDVTNLMNIEKIILEKRE